MDASAAAASTWQGPSPPLDLYTRGLRLVQGIDAVSPHSDAAFATAADFMHAKDDHLTLLHLHAPGGAEAAAALAAHYSTKLLARFSRKRYDVTLAPLPAGVPLRAAVLAAVRGVRADLAVLGFSSLHGPPAQRAAKLMGSAEDLSLREGHTSALVIKSWEAREGAAGAQTILVGLDGSVRSQQALLLALRLARAGRDVVRAVHVQGLGGGGVAGERGGDAVEAGVRALLAPALASGVDAALLRRPLTAALASPGAVLHAAADELGASLVVIGADGLGSSAAERRVGLGSCSDHVLRNVSCNVLLFHEPRHAVGAVEAAHDASAAAAAAAGAAAAGAAAAAKGSGGGGGPARH